MAVFSKVVSQYDFASRFVVPNAFHRLINGRDGGAEITVRAYDTGFRYDFVLSVRKGERKKYKKPVFQQKGWQRFVKDNGVPTGDTITFWKDVQTGEFVIRSVRPYIKYL